MDFRKKEEGFSYLGEKEEGFSYLGEKEEAIIIKFRVSGIKNVLTVGRGC
jgi:hypothetical protein